MGKFACECGEYVFSDTILPNDQYYSLVPSGIMMDYPERLGEDGDWIVSDDEVEIWECPKCKGLTRFDNSAERTCYYKRIDA